jgi:hypothetical protein
VKSNVVKLPDLRNFLDIRILAFGARKGVLSMSDLSEINNCEAHVFNSNI